MNHQKIYKENHEEIIRMFTNGNTYSRIADKFKVSRVRIYQIVRTLLPITEIKRIIKQRKTL